MLENPITYADILNLHGKCPFCLKAPLSMPKLIPNVQINKIIKWFQTQRAYRAQIWRVEMQNEVKNS